jgi:hypothetical protein
MNLQITGNNAHLHMGHVTDHSLYLQTTAVKEAQVERMFVSEVLEIGKL